MRFILNYLFTVAETNFWNGSGLWRNLNHQVSCFRVKVGLTSIPPKFEIFIRGNPSLVKPVEIRLHGF